jgi:hypothetical protein
MKSYNIMTMKRKAISIAVLMILSFSWIMAQNPNMERLNAYKIAFFTKRLDLTSQEAEKFWPVYNEFQGNKLKIQQERIQLNRNFNLNISAMSDKEMTKGIDDYIALETKEAELSQEFHKKFKEILPPLKVIRLYQAENQYKMQLLNELQDRRQTRGNFNQQ